LLQWTDRLRPRLTRRELQQLKRQVTLLQPAVWIGVATASQGERTDIDERVRTMLVLDGWRPDIQLAEQAGYFSMDRVREDNFGGPEA